MRCSNLVVSIVSYTTLSLLFLIKSYKASIFSESVSFEISSTDSFLASAILVTATFLVSSLNFLKFF